MKRQRNKGGLIALLLLVGILGTSAYAFTASNTINTPGTAGDGTVALTGYTVDNVQFSIPSTATGATTVTFDLSAAATTVKASGSDTGSGLVPCTETATPNNWTCTLNESLTDANNLRVVAFS
jgi:hypothetical protein